MKLYEFIDIKAKELSNTYRKVEVYTYDDCVLSKSSASETFNSTKSNLYKVGYEPVMSELPIVSTFEFIPNGTVVKFEVVAPRKRKSEFKAFYFKWEE